MSGPAFALVALSGHPLFDAARADAAGVEGMPFVAAGAAPDFVSRRFPLAEGTADSRSGNAGADAGAFDCNYLAHGSFDSMRRAGVSYTACRNGSPKRIGTGPGTTRVRSRAPHLSTLAQTVRIGRAIWTESAELYAGRRTALRCAEVAPAPVRPGIHSKRLGYRS